MTKARQLERVFKMGSTLLTDPDPMLKPEEVIALYSAQYPHLKSATISDPYINDEETKLIFTVVRPEVTTKGGESEKETIRKLTIWAQQNNPHHMTWDSFVPKLHYLTTKTIKKGKSSLSSDLTAPV